LQPPITGHLPQRQVPYFFCLSILKIIDFKQYMGFKGSFNRNYLRMKKNITRADVRRDEHPQLQ
jgi:hypothetical protein